MATALLALILYMPSARQADCAVCFAQTAPTAQAPEVATSISGTVVDSAGGAIAGAIVIARSPTGAEQQTVTGSEGLFAFNTFAAGEFDLIVRVAGFAELRQTIAANAPRRGLTLKVELEAVSESVTVTVARMEQRMGDIAASVNVLSKNEIRQSPAVLADDVLRQIPSFSLFRRSSSVAAHPTTQGVSLRGIGPSGVSRTLVLLDGVPFNDPFGGWVFWSRIPLEDAERIEVVEGASSSLYGNYAMGGLINIVTTPAARRTVEIKTQYGNRTSPKVDFRGSDVWGGKLGVSVDGSVFSTDGYPTVLASSDPVKNEKGLVDTNSTLDFKTVNVKLDYRPTDRVQAFLRTGYFTENRINGKVTTVGTIQPEKNDTSWTSASGGVRVRTADQSEIQGTIFTDFETFNSNNVAVPTATPRRSLGRLSLEQSVPSKSVGGMFQWARPVTGIHLLSAGVDWRWVDGDSEEKSFDAVTGTTVTQHRNVGGTQRSVGVFFQDLITPLPKLTVTLSARFDSWKNYNAHFLETNQPSGTPTANNNPNLPGRNDSAASPRVAAIYHVNDKVTIWGDVGGGFRAPTLNELYRGFRVGTQTTVANNQLGPERLVVGEGGVNLAPAKNMVVRFVAFDDRIRRPIANVTITQVGDNVTLQRQNLGRTRIWGLQSDIEYRFGRNWRVNAAYLYGEAKVVEFNAPPPQQPLAGKYLPQVPKNRGSLTVAYSNPALINVSVSVQAIGMQFDDDQNFRGIPGNAEAGLPAYALVGLTASKPIGRNLEFFLGAQNLLNQEYFVGTLPTLVGAPRLVNAGVRVSFRGR